ncbi:cysteine--tRNA ligase [Rhizobium sp. NRK18]|uniref:cysteine--tRNA ligase n=1 Tax=Rhizobium sp. NRK18 TaxID=2964667 RepID=UPI0021C4893B|nr:cysteine--tRNA ligase [Rhizobium sp. NRK18]MCQ2004738.1 cysteine--tRNA ligase [Rhizobium sp. NRK18]
MTELKLYNTLTREKTVFQPIDPDNVRMYVCGPTVYDFAHIGNARPVIVFDVLYRLLRHVYGADHVTYVRNITDVDDKINARALRDHPNLPLNEAIRLVTEKTETQFLDDVNALGTLEPTVQPRATDNITQMVAIIQSLLDKGHAYVAEGSEGREVLFEVRSMADYGQLSKRNLDDQQAGARIAVEAHKRNPADFVLWKQSANTEPGWHADFTVDGTTTDIYGRPGWHIECSAMSGRYLGDTFDIHGGGLDLIFPHHENEIAQSRCAHGTHVMANVWMHNGFLQVEGRKMSKSEGNFVTIHELLATEKFGGRTWPGEVLRLAMLMTHYRQPIDFSVKRLIEAENILQTWADIKKIASDHDWMALANRLVDPIVTDEFISTLADDLNTAGAIAYVQAEAKKAHKGDADAAFNVLNSFIFLGFELEDFFASADVEAFEQILIREKILERLELIKAKNWGEADKIRDDLLAKGIQLKDGKDPETGERVTTWEVKR